MMMSVSLRAIKECENRRHPQLAAEHYLLSLVHEQAEDPDVSAILREIGITYEALNQVLMSMVPPNSHAPHSNPPDHFLTEALERAKVQAGQMVHEEVDSRHLLWGILGDPRNNAVIALMTMGVDVGRLKDRTMEFLMAD